MIYEWKKGFTKKADANLVANELESLEKKTPETALAYAEENEQSELHKCVTWDDSTAAKKFRISEMRSVIRSVVIVDDNSDDDEDSDNQEPLIYRAFEYVDIAGEGDESSKESGRQFMSTPEALQDDYFKHQIMADISSAMQALINKANTYSYLAKQPIEKAITHMEKAKRVIDSACPEKSEMRISQ